jgi:hypothetical protein
MGFVPTGHRPIKRRHFYQAGDNRCATTASFNVTYVVHNYKYNIQKTYLNS